MSVNPITKEQWYSKCWEYFALLSSQRMKLFEFYITLEVFLLGSFITLNSLTLAFVLAKRAVSLLIIIISVVFLGLDYRTKTMIHECEEAMVAIEQSDVGDSKYHPISRVNSCKKAKITYTKYIRFLQAIFILLGFACLFFS